MVWRGNFHQRRGPREKKTNFSLEMAFWSILSGTFLKIWQKICISVPTPNSGGIDLPVSPCFTPIMVPLH